MTRQRVWCRHMRNVISCAIHDAPPFHHELEEREAVHERRLLSACSVSSFMHAWLDVQTSGWEDGLPWISTHVA